MRQGAAPGLGAGGRPNQRSRLPAPVERPLGCAPADDLQPPHRAGEKHVDLSLRPIAGESAPLHPEFLAQVHIHHLIRPLQMQDDAVRPGAASQDQL